MCVCVCVCGKKKLNFLSFEPITRRDIWRLNLNTQDSNLATTEIRPAAGILSNG